jgi:hypothetical protein
MRSVALLLIFAAAQACESTTPAASPEAPPAPEPQQRIVYHCVESQQQETGWCGRWELGCKGKGPYRLVTTRQEPAVCRGTTPEVHLSCETAAGVSRGKPCTAFPETP